MAVAETDILYGATVPSLQQAISSSNPPVVPCHSLVLVNWNGWEVVRGD